MKKLLLMLLTISSIATYAGVIDCSKPEVQNKILNKLNKKNPAELTITYSADLADKAKVCQQFIASNKPAIKLTMTQVSGVGMLNFGR